MHDHHDAPGYGHNHGPRRAVQWQTPHQAHHHHPEEQGPAEPDFDLVEAAFVESFATSSDPTSFLRLAGIPFVGTDGSGLRLSLLRVEIDQTTDLGALTPHLGGGSFRYDPLPAKLISRRRRLRLVYHDGSATRALSLAEAKGLVAEPLR